MKIEETLLFRTVSLSKVGTVPLEAPFVPLHTVIGPGIASWYQVSHSALGFAMFGGSC